MDHPSGDEDHRVPVDLPRHHPAIDQIRHIVVRPVRSPWQRMDLVSREIVDAEHVPLFLEAEDRGGVGRGEHQIVIVRPFDPAQLVFADADPANHFPVGDGGHDHDPHVALGANISDTQTIGVTAQHPRRSAGCRRR